MAAKNHIKHLSAIAILFSSFVLSVTPGCTFHETSSYSEAVPLSPGLVLQSDELKTDRRFELRDLRITQDGTRVLAIFGTGNEEQIFLWDAKSGKLIRNRSLSDRGLGRILFSSDASVVSHRKEFGLNKFGLVAWNSDTEEILLELTDHRIAASAVSAHGKALATYSKAEESGIDLWDLETGEKEWSLNLGDKNRNAGNFDRVRSLHFSPDGVFLIVGFDHGEPMQVWDITKRTIVSRLWGHVNAPEVLVFSIDGRRMASTGVSCKTVRIWDTGTWQETHRLPGGQVSQPSLAFTNQGKSLWCLWEENTAVLWDLAETDGVIRNSARLEASGSLLPQEERLADSDTLIAPTADYMLRMFRSKGSGRYWPIVFPIVGIDPSKGVQKRDNKFATTTRTEGHDQPDVRIGFPFRSTPLFSPSGEHLVVFGKRDVVVIDPARGVVRRTLEYPTSMFGPEISADFSPDGELIAAVDSLRGQENVVIWRMSDGTRTTLKPKFPAGRKRSIRCLTFSPDGQNLALGTGREIHLVRRNGVVDAMLSDRFMLGIDAVAYLPDGETVIGLGDNGTHVVYWNTKDGTTRTKHVLPEPKLRGPMVVMSPKVQMAATSSERSDIVIWRLLTGEVVQSWETPLTYARGVAMSSDGTYAATWPGSGNGVDRPVSIHVYDVGAGEIISSYDLPESQEVHWVAISPDNRNLVAGEYNAINIWRLPIR